MREGNVKRMTKETQILVSINLDGEGKSSLKIPSGFLAHMLDLFSKHGLFDLEIEAKGDTWIDEHHTVEDLGICLGKAILHAVGEKKGIRRYGTMILPMDDVLVLVSLDLAGRYAFSFDASFTREKVGNLPTELVSHFFDSLAQNASMNLHIKVMTPGNNEHHRIEGIFKAFARALRKAVEIDDRMQGAIPSTKGVL